MGTTLWVLGKSSVGAGDSWDHSAMFDAADALDGLCDALEVPKISGYFDWTDFNANLSDDGYSVKDAVSADASWFDAQGALPALQALRNHVAANADAIVNPGQFGYENLQAQLVEELDDCIAKVEMLASKGERFHLCVVM